MSHELRTPLNNLLILARMLSENSDKNLTPKQVKFAETIHTSGTDLLALISDILDLSKIESGKMDVEVGGVRFTELQTTARRRSGTWRTARVWTSRIELGSSLSSEIMHTDAKRLQQVLKNLLSNALKFTEHGSVRLTIDKATSGWSPDHMTAQPRQIRDRVFGGRYRHRHPADKQRIIFEAFQQADGTTSRKYGGTGLGLSISRELARLLGGEIRLQSAPGVGSTFTLYLPQTYVTPGAAAQERSAAASPPVLLEQAADGTADAEVDMILPSPRWPTEELVEDLVIDDDRNLIQPGDVASADRRRRHYLRAHSGRSGARSRPEGAGGAARQQRHVAGARVQAGRDHARHQSSRYGGLDHSGSPEARSGHAAHSGAYHFRR